MKKIILFHTAAILLTLGGCAHQSYNYVDPKTALLNDPLYGPIYAEKERLRDARQKGLISQDVYMIQMQQLNAEVRAISRQNEMMLRQHRIAAFNDAMNGISNIQFR